MASVSRFEGIKIAAIAAAVPDKIVANDCYLPLQGEDTVRKFEKMTGVLERRHSVTVTTCGLSTVAANALRERGFWSVDDVDGIIFISQTQDYRLPATACVMHGDLGIKKDCVAFDISLGCSGFVYGIFIASNLLVSGACQKIIVCGGDCSSRCVAEDDIANKMLFGDAGYAAILEQSQDGGQTIPFLLGTDGTGCDAIHALGAGLNPIIKGKRIPDPLLKMDGPEVFNFTISAIPLAIKDFCDASGSQLGEFDHFAFHQANRFILKQIAMLAGFSNMKHLISLDKYGNTSSASIPLTLCANNNNLTGKTLMAGFGVGLSWGVAAYDFSRTRCLDVITVKEGAE